MEIDEELVTYLEDLSCLSLSETEKKHISVDLMGILKYMSRLGELDTVDVPERSHPYDNTNAFREDEVKPSFDRELILENAPRRNDEMIIAPKTVE